MKPQLIILSDLWGTLKDEWVNHYYSILKGFYEIKCYDCRKLANINLEITSEQELHSEFVDGGIDRAVLNLIHQELKPSHILAFSIGGVIAWKAALNGLNTLQIHAISSTRLRNEKLSPNCKIKLYFGEHDLYKPDSEWFQKLKIDPTIIQCGDHLIYQEPQVIRSICNNLLLD